MIAESHEILPSIDSSRGKKLVRFDYSVIPAAADRNETVRFSQVLVDPEAGREEIIAAIDMETGCGQDDASKWADDALAGVTI